MKTARHFLLRSCLRCFFFLFCGSLLFCTASFAQQTDEASLRNVKVDELTDDQVKNFILEADRLSISDSQIDALALQRGMNPDEIVKLKYRIQATRKALSSLNYSPSNPPARLPADTLSARSDSFRRVEQRPLENYNSAFSALQSRNFGFEVFNNPRISFEPNLRLPTPENYRLSTDDVLQVEVSGVSQASYTLRISPEGIVRIPVAGPIAVNGLTIEQARRVITNKLASTIYTNIRSGKTRVDVNVGNIRSIRVTIIGEATVPGTYTLPSLASAYNALYACGGPNANGSFRNIQVIRNGKTVATIDVYKYLSSGTRSNDINLRDEDVIKINPYGVRIELKGEVKKPGIYDVRPGETLADIIRFANGFTDNAYTDRIQVFSNTAKERQVTTVASGAVATVIPKSADTYIVGKILNRFSNRISINGAVYRPGEYELTPGMTLLQLVQEADGLREDAFTSRATLHRLKEDLSPEIVSFDVTQLLKGTLPDIQLRREDRVMIYSKFDLKEGYFVAIEGEVSGPGFFLYEEGMTVQDLILMAGGLKEAAAVKHIEISRRIKNPEGDTATIKTATIFQRDIAPDLKDSAAYQSVVLQPFDEITIHPAPGYYVQKNAVIEGEALFTGKYTLAEKNNRISDLIKRAGGLTPQAYMAGAILVRAKNLSKTELANNQQGIFNLLKDNLESGAPTALLQAQLDYNAQKHSENVDIDLQKIVEHPGSQYDLLLNDGDTLRVPKQLQTVRVNGEVLYPSLVRYDKDYSFKTYISRAGGFDQRALRRKSYVVFANGSVKGTRHFLFFRNYPDMQPGAEVFVPVKRQPQRLRAGELVAVGATLVTMFAVIFNLVK